MIKKPVLSDPEKIPATARPGKPEHNHVYFMKALSSGLRKGPPKKGKKYKTIAIEGVGGANA